MHHWLGSISAAEFVVTDSFHGAAMSIILNKPYVALVNRARSAAGFASMHRSLGLQNRLVWEIGDSVPAPVAAPVAWGRVNRIIADERLQPGRYLAANVPSLSVTGLSGPGLGARPSGTVPASVGELR